MDGSTYVGVEQSIYEDANLIQYYNMHPTKIGHSKNKYYTSLSVNYAQKNEIIYAGSNRGSIDCISLKKEDVKKRITKRIFLLSDKAKMFLEVHWVAPHFLLAITNYKELYFLDVADPQKANLV